jgi:hypothetical protein
VRTRDPSQGAAPLAAGALPLHTHLRKAQLVAVVEEGAHCCGVPVAVAAGKALRRVWSVRRVGPPACPFWAGAAQR